VRFGGEPGQAVHIMMITFDLMRRESRGKKKKRAEVNVEIMRPVRVSITLVNTVYDKLKYSTFSDNVPVLPRPAPPPPGPCLSPHRPC
jgi:hypothetical protein